MPLVGKVVLEEGGGGSVSGASYFNKLPPLFSILDEDVDISLLPIHREGQRRE